MLRTTLKNLRSHLRRLVSTSLAVVLGVGFLAATLFIGDTMRGSFDQAFTEANDGLAVAVRSQVQFGDTDIVSQNGTVDITLADEIRQLDGVDAVQISIEGTAQIVGANGDPIGGGGPPTLGRNWIDDPRLNPYELAEGRAPVAPDEVVIDRGAAEAGDLAVGDTTTIRSPEPVPVEIVGIVTFGDQDSLGPSTYAAFTTERAQELFVGDAGAADRLLVAAETDVDHDDLAAQVAALLPDDLETLTAAEVAADQLADIEGDFIGFFETMLLGFAGIALLVATFSIHNTFSILVAQRTRESALLRAIGASRAQVLGAVALEAAVIGVVATTVGLAVGVGLAQLAMAAMDAAGFGMAGSIVLSSGAVLAAAAIGVGVTLVASLAPSLAASRVPPLAAIRDVATERTSASKGRVIAGAVLLVGAGLALLTAPSAGDGAPARAGLAAAVVLVAAVMLGPVAARPLAGALGRPIAALRGHTGLLARRNAMRNPRRTSGTASALTLGVAVVALFTVFASSITTSIDDTVDRSFGGDLVVSTGFGEAALSGDLAAAIGELPEVAAAIPLGSAVAEVNGEVVYPTPTDPAGLEGVLDLDVQEGSLDDVGIDGMAVGTRRADDEGWSLGDAVTLDLADGTQEVLRVGALYNSIDLVGDMLVHRDMWSAHTAQITDVAVLIDVADGVDLTAANVAVTGVSERFAAPAPQDRDEFVETAAGQVNQVLGVVYGLLAVAVLIALMGIANTVSLSVHERTRELGLLRAVGQTRSQLRAMVRWESVIVAVFGAVSGVVVGVLIGWGVLRAIAEAEGVATPLTLPATSLAIVVAVGAVAGVLAAVRPARRAARLDVLQAIATD
ncbi:MAG: FtsX-like permease family protein [Acidimicrobiia bacterium]|nr:FtsX-like permease family protein [Acidimicrobiia bacterium]